MKDKKIEREKEKIRRKNEKIATKEANDKNLPVVEPKGIKKFFKKLGVRVGIIATAALALFAVTKDSDKDAKNGPEENTTDIERESDNATIEDNKRANKALREVGINEFGEVESKVQETQPTMQDELKDLTNVATPAPVRESGAENIIFTEIPDSVETKTQDKGQEASKIEIEETTSKSENETEKTTETKLESDDLTVNVTSTGGNVELETDAKGETIIITDGTKGSIDIEIGDGYTKDEGTIEVEEETIEPVNPFEDDYER